MNENSVEVISNEALIQLPTNQLLNKFGSGSHAPGSGSAAALMGLLSSKLILTVASISLQKEEYRKDYKVIEFLASQISNEIEPRLLKLFELDAVVFNDVIKARVARDNSTDEKEKRHHGELALQKLREATEIPFEICEICIKLIDLGASMFDIGFKSARGDTGAAISAGVAGAMAGIFVINLNLKSFRESDWAIEKRKLCDKLHKELEKKQLEAFSKVMTLRAEDVNSMSFPFYDETDTSAPLTPRRATET